MRNLHARPRRRDSRGQALAIVALMLPVLLAFMALGVDAANMFLERREAQSVADLAAISGARSLPANAAQARNDACAVAALNGFTTSSTHPCPNVTVNTPHAGAATRIEVVINETVNTFFMPILGINTVDVGARAVALSEPTVAGNFAVFALASNCSATESEKVIDWSGSTTTINGRVHSQSGVLIGGSSNSVPAPGTFSYKCTGEFQESGTNAGIPPQAPGACPGSLVNTPCRQDLAPPVFFDAATFNSSPNPPCNWTVNSGDMDLSSGTTGNGATGWWNNSAKTQLKAGKYCAPNGTIKGFTQHARDVNFGGRTGVTFFGRKVELAASNLNLKPYDRGVLLYATSSDPDALKFNGSDGAFVGLLYAPNGTAEISGSTNGTISGGIVANRVKLNGSTLSITGTVGASSEGYQQLVE